LCASAVRVGCGLVQVQPSTFVAACCFSCVVGVAPFLWHMASNGGAPEPAHKQIAHEIGVQVEKMILDAKIASETKVGKEIGKIGQKMNAIHEKMKGVGERVSRLDSNVEALTRSWLSKSIAKLEEVWESEVSTLKHELWQTIQAHNHNADLLKHHKDAIDGIVNRAISEAEATTSPELEQVHAQTLQIEKILQREAVKEQQMDQLMHRLAVVQQQLGVGMGPWATGGAVGAPPPLTTLTAGAAPVAQAKKTQQRKNANGASKSKAAKAQHAGADGGLRLRAEAPEFVPKFSES